MKRRLLLAILISTLLTGAGLVATPTLFAGQNQKQKAEKEEREEGKEEDDEQGEAADQAKLASQAKFTREQAQEIALKRAPGTVESSELEREHGKLVYSFDIRNAKGTIDEVQVSAITGKIVRVEHETKEQEEAEKKADEKKKHYN